jgi:predicted RNA methylase
MHFTAHNIRLPDGTYTWPEGALLEEEGTFRAPVRMLNLVFPAGLDGKSIADLGCLEGGFTIGFARLGMEATGIEIRESNLVNCRHVQSKLNLPNLRFIKDDVNNIDKYEPFDVIFAPGIFYHLDRPRAFLEKASSVCRKVIFLETHFTYKHRTAAVENYRLSELCENEGLMGRWYTEHDDVPGPELDAKKWASWENKRSFWIQKEYLLDLLTKVGFDIVLEQYDIFAGNMLDGMDGHYNALDRGMFVGIRAAS